MTKTHSIQKIPVGILGATGMVGQQYIRLLENHPWFRVAYVAASPQSAGKSYKEAVQSRWVMDDDLPADVGKIIVEDVANVAMAQKKCAYVFSAFEMDDKDAIRRTEDAYAAHGMAVLSNASAHRWTEDVPMLIPEINADHTKMILLQQKKRKWKRGFIAVKPNCSLQSYLTPVYALMQAGYEVKKLFITTMQAVSGAGYPGVPSLDMIDNIIPYIGGEEEKTEQEPLKILGDIDIKSGKFVNFQGLAISAHCNRVPVRNGHTACVSLLFGKKKPTQQEILKIWREFRALPQTLKLPSAPEQPIVYRDEPNRPQPRKDRDVQKGMAVTVGRLRPCPLFDYKFVGLSHNTARGAAGGGILNAELLFKQGFLQAKS